MSRLVVWTAVGVAAVVAGVLATEPPPAPPRPVQPAAQLPKVPELPAAPDRAESLALLATTSIWGPRPTAAPAAPASAASAAPPPRWFISGTLNAGAAWRAVLRFENGAQPSRLLQAGDELPDGSRVLEIRRDGVRIGPSQTKGQRRTKRDGVPERWIELPRRAFES